MSIERHYNELRVSANDAAEIRKVLALGVTAECVFNSGFHCSVLFTARRRIVAQFNRLAAEAWPLARMRFAADGGKMPAGPVQLQETGYTVAFVRSVTLTANRPAEPNDWLPTLLADAAEEALVLARREQEYAEAMFSQYQLCVQQGIAIDPDVAMGTAFAADARSVESDIEEGRL